MSAPQFIYGRHAVTQMLEGSPKSVRRVLINQQNATRCADIHSLASAGRVPVSVVSKQQLASLAREGTHQGVVAEIDGFSYVDLEAILARAQNEVPLIVVCDSLQDPHNLGAILRSALVMGAHGVVIPKDRACEITPTVVKTAAGAAAHLPVARVTNLRRALATLKDAGLWVVGTAGDAQQDLCDVDLKMPLALVVGSEGNGMRAGIHAACDFIAKIPMQSTLGSLNASVAAAIALYETGRQRTAGATSKRSIKP